VDSTHLGLSPDESAIFERFDRELRALVVRPEYAAANYVVILLLINMTANLLNAQLQAEPGGLPATMALLDQMRAAVRAGVPDTIVRH
jgi:hypothetical protein